MKSKREFLENGGEKGTLRGQDFGDDQWRKRSQPQSMILEAVLPHAYTGLVPGAFYPTIHFGK